MNETIDYYNQNASDFMAETVKVNFEETQKMFLRYLPKNALILDFGCGSGRDTKYFLEHGYRVEATDGSLEICKAATKISGIPVKQMLFQELNEKQKYDGIWACASILHLPKNILLIVLQKMCDAIKDHGTIYTSFKYGCCEREKNGRYFTDFTEETFEKFMRQKPGLKIEKTWITSDVRAERGDERWLNIILRKAGTH